MPALTAKPLTARPLTAVPFTAKTLGQAVSSLSQYAVNGFEPGLVFNPTADYFKTTQGNYTDLEDAATFSRSGLATMVDSDGVLKWAPHNLLIGNNIAYDTTLANGVVGYSSAATAARDFAGYNVGVLPAGEYTVSFWVDEISGPLTRPIFYFLGANPATALSKSDIVIGLNTLTFTWAGGDIGQIRLGVGTDANDTGTFLSGGYHLYRSDLGGMVNNPARGDSYVPTTSAARYLPRVNHHIWNGSAWVNEGLLIESEARTNLIATAPPQSSSTALSSRQAPPPPVTSPPLAQQPPAQQKP
jgi:hypothetical protein